MDAMRLLGGLLGNNSLGRGLGGQVLNTLMRGTGRRRGSSTAASVLGGLAIAAVQQYMRSANTPSQAPPTISTLAGMEAPPLNHGQAEQQARLLVEAMLAAARADGQVDRDEQAKILSQLGELDADERQFLQDTMARPVDLDDLARRTPTELRGALYAAALSAIQVDTLEETHFLQELAAKLGLSSQELGEIHGDLGLPPPLPMGG